MATLEVNCSSDSLLLSIAAIVAILEISHCGQLSFFSSWALFCSEKTEVIFKDSFLTILYPADRFSEMGPSSRTYFSDSGFTCLQILDYIYRFYQV